MTLRVNHGQMMIAAENLKKAANKIDVRLNELETFVQNEISKGWTGDQKDAYDIAKRDWDKVIADMKTHLELQSAQVESTNQEFVLTDKMRAAAIGGIKVPK